MLLKTLNCFENIEHVYWKIQTNQEKLKDDRKKRTP